MINMIFIMLIMCVPDFDDIYSNIDIYNDIDIYDIYSNIDIYDIYKQKLFYTISMHVCILYGF
jgi:hypothetical protein